MTGIVPRRAVERCEKLAALGPPPAWWRVSALRRWLRAYRAIMALDISVHAELLRELYPVDRIVAAARRPHPLAAMLRDAPVEFRVVAPDPARGTVEYEEL